MKILVAEDDPVSNHAITRILEYWDHEVISVRDGLKAWDIITKKWKPDILLSDWDMPSMNGPKLCERIRNDPSNDDIYIIMLTAKNNMTDMMDGFWSGVDDYLSKPVTETELKESLNIGISFLNGEEGFNDRDELISKNIIKFQTKQQQ